MLGRYKPSNKDFTNELLPLTRKDQFFDFLKIHKLSLFKIGLILLLFAVPLLSIIIYQQISQIYVSNLYSSGEITIETMNYNILIIDLITNGLKFIALAVFSAGLAGVLKIYRNLCWNEGVFFGDDFKKGLKENFKQTFLTTMLLYVFVFIAFIFRDIANFTGSIFFVAGFYLSLGIEVIIIIPLCLFMYTQIACYTCKLSLLFSNSFTLLMIKYWAAIIFSLILFILLGCYFFIPVPIGIFVLVLIIVLLIPFYLLAFQLFSLNAFDETINEEYPDYFRKGLRKLHK